MLHHGVLDEADIMVHTGKSSDDVKDRLQDVDKLWATVRLLMYTPTIEAGKCPCPPTLVQLLEINGALVDTA